MSRRTHAPAIVREPHLKPERKAGFTLVELIMFIVIVGVGLAGILLALNQGVMNSADPLTRKQAQAIAQSLMEEISLQAFTYCDPDDPNVGTATSAAGCTTPEAVGPETGETRFASPQFDNVNDYHGYSMASIVDITNTAVPGLTGYSASVSVQPAALGSITAASGDALLIRVTVNGPNGAQFILDGYRTRYDPNAAP
jgi:MSHA pilin protein MshD